ncbi:MAG: thymidine phosphorylase [Kiritimatiellia bacterium]
MIVKLLLDRKREGRELPAEDIRQLVDAYTRGEVPDYQMAAFAMAVCCRGMTDAETLALTRAMRDSGRCLDWSDVPQPTADKHSTGGVGDKLSLVVQPLAAACGLAVPSLTGRGLGLTGGTADKMESIPGYVAGLSLADYHRVVADCGCTLTVQTEEIAPADRKLYGLRDVTGTVPSIPLIVASILSKKLAEGARTLVFDVKCGSGAFMKTRADATALARALVAISRDAGRKAAALVTTMDEPLGLTVGNALEVEEAIEVLRGVSNAADVAELSVALAARMVALAQGLSREEAVARCRANLANGAAYRRFVRMVELHGGSLEKFAAVCAEPVETREVKATANGFVAKIEALPVAQAAFELGAGRAQTADALDLRAGVRLRVTHGDAVVAGQTIAVLQARDRPEKLPAAAELVATAITVSSTRSVPPPRIVEEIA